SHRHPLGAPGTRHAASNEGGVRCLWDLEQASAHRFAEPLATGGDRVSSAPSPGRPPGPLEVYHPGTHPAADLCHLLFATRRIAAVLSALPGECAARRF